MTPTENSNAKTPPEMNRKTPAPTVGSVEEGLEQIDRILHQMLLLAELSASSVSTDRDRLQRTIERLKAKINRIADTIS